jgi:hypothetical protein
MLPSEKAERWVRRVGYAALILIALYILVWVVRFIWGNYHKAMEQRQFPAEAKAPVEFTVHGLRFTGPNAVGLPVNRKL